MTVASTLSRATYLGDGVSTAFPVPFRFIDAAHLRVVRRSSAGVETTLVLSVDYSVSGADNPAGGSVTLGTAPAVGEVLAIIRNVPMDQTLDYVANDPFPAESHERGLDKLTMALQQVDEQVDRSLRVPVTDAPISAFPSAAERAGKFLAFGAGGLDVVASEGTGADDGLRADLAAGDGGGLLGFLEGGAGAVLMSLLAKLREFPSIAGYGADLSGVDSSQAAYLLAQAATGGRFHIPSGARIKLDAIADPTVAPNIWLDAFTAGDDVVLNIGGVDYDVSNAVHGAWRFEVTSERYLTMKHARTGAEIVRWSNGELSSDSHRFWLPLDIRRDSHALLIEPGQAGDGTASSDGKVDFLWRRPEDPTAGADHDNRFMIAYDEYQDVWGVYYATADTDPPAFDAAMEIKGGTAAGMEFVALRPNFRQGFSVKRRSTGVFQMDVVAGVNSVDFRRNSDNTTLAQFTTDGFLFGNYLYMALGTSRMIVMGNGSPEGVQAASQGSLFLRMNGSIGSNIYFKQSGTGNTGWAAISGI
jgi:hypothetical protein